VTRDRFRHLYVQSQTTVFFKGFSPTFSPPPLFFFFPLPLRLLARPSTPVPARDCRDPSTLISIRRKRFILPFFFFPLFLFLGSLFSFYRSTRRRKLAFSRTTFLSSIFLPSLFFLFFFSPPFFPSFWNSVSIFSVFQAEELTTANRKTSSISYAPPFFPPPFFPFFSFLSECPKGQAAARTLADL